MNWKLEVKLMGWFAMICVFSMFLACLVSHKADAATEACAERPRVLQGLLKNYGEVPIARGIAVPAGPRGRHARMVEILASPETSSWTLIITETNGVACVVITGEGWQSLLGQEVAR